MYEKKSDHVISRRAFIGRLARHFIMAILMILVALSIGIGGYHWLGDFSWIDSLLEASMILSGMGPVNPLSSAPAKVFASVYALFSGVVFIAIMGIILAPVAHRLLHTFHAD
ncbi:MAG: hypothetical protein KA522_02905 [Candidatus Saccharicenans sp.]|jgi:cytochrome b subunit of formate dehydrogenase|nr:hypothetical protein [Candidatus Saccharicenans sp.]